MQDTDKVILLDEKTHQIIINCTRLVGDRFDNNAKYGVVDVSRVIKSDSMPEPREVKKVTELFVQCATAIADILESGKDALIYCKNGRSRSPAVVVAFFIIFRGYELDAIKGWFNEAYPSQRPETARVSTNFPNFDKYEQVMALLEKSISEPSSLCPTRSYDRSWLPPSAIPPRFRPKYEHLNCQKDQSIASQMKASSRNLPPAPLTVIQNQMMMEPSVQRCHQIQLFQIQQFNWMHMMHQQTFLYLQELEGECVSNEMDRIWFNQYKKAAFYFMAHGNCDIRHDQNDPRFGEWARDQRIYYAKGTLKQWRKAALNKLGFAWN